MIESDKKTASGAPVWRLSKIGGVEINYEFYLSAASVEAGPGLFLKGSAAIRKLLSRLRFRIPERDYR
ncbi:hypothetical protein [Pseudomonas farris]